MDAQAKKALFRAKLKEQSQKKRIESPLVWYNQHDQPVCRVCNIVLKSDSIWPAHQASRKHLEAINTLKASASKQNPVEHAKSAPTKELPKHQHVDSEGDGDAKKESSAEPKKSRPSSVLPADFFDNHTTKKQNVASDAAKSVDTGSSTKEGGVSAQTPETELVDTGKPASTVAVSAIGANHSEVPPTRNSTAGNTSTQAKTAGSQTNQTKGTLPEGFFDNKDADLRARGIEPVKPDIKDEYKEFEKLIQEDLAEVDNRLEEEEIDAAEVLGEEETIEQKTYRERVETLKRKKMELIAAKSSKDGPVSDIASKKPGQDGPSSEDDDDDDESFTVDWRAQHLK